MNLVTSTVTGFPALLSVHLWVLSSSQSFHVYHEWDAPHCRSTAAVIVAVPSLSPASSLVHAYSGQPCGSLATGTYPVTKKNC